MKYKMEKLIGFHTTFEPVINEAATELLITLYYNAGLGLETYIVSFDEIFRHKIASFFTFD